MLKPTGKIKQIPEDFIVEEITPDGEILEINKNYQFQKNSKGRFLHCILVQKGIGTIESINRVAKELKIDSRRITFAGTKDRHAVTAQKISFVDVPLERVERLDAGNILVSALKYGTKKTFIGDLAGNRFTVTVRNISLAKSQVADHIGATINRLGGKFPNYFGEQRFGTAENTTDQIGKALLEREYSKAYELYSKEKLPEKDAIRQLKQVSMSLRKMFIHAYQSRLFNVLLEMMMVDGKRPAKLPLIGFDFRPLSSSEYSSHVQKIIREEKLDMSKFRIPEFPELIARTELRAAFQEFRDFSVLKIAKDELNNGRLKVVLQFSLPKGSYATVFLKELFSPES